MCYSNNNCGYGSGSCFSCSSVCCNNSTRSCACGGNSADTDMPYYINPCGWYTCSGRVALLALVSVGSLGSGSGCSCGGCNSCCNSCCC